MVGGLQRLTTFTTAAFNSEWSLRLPTTFYILLQEPPKSLEVMQGILVTMIKLSYINPRHRPKKASTATWRCIYIYMLHIHYHHYHPSIKHASLCFYSVLMKWSPFHDLFQQEIWAAGPTTPGVSSAPHAAAHVKPSASPWGPWRCRWQASGNHVALFLEDAAKEWAYIYIYNFENVWCTL